MQGSRSPLLSQPTRRRIYDFLLAQPGSHFRDIVRLLGTGYGATLHHLNVLAGARIVRSNKGAGKRRYYPVGMGSEPGKNRLFERYWEYRDLRLRVLVAVRRMGPTGPTAVGRSLGVSRQLAGYHLSRLVELGFVRREGRRYTASR